MKDTPHILEFDHKVWDHDGKTPNTNTEWYELSTAQQNAPLLLDIPKKAGVMILMIMPAPNRSWIGPMKIGLIYPQQYNRPQWPCDLPNRFRTITGEPSILKRNGMERLVKRTIQDHENIKLYPTTLFWWFSNNWTRKIWLIYHTMSNQPQPP